MKIAILLGGALAGAVPAPATAQTVNDDVRCVLLSAGFARMTKDQNSRRAAAMTGAFFLGRLSGRLSGDALTAAIRAQGRGLPEKQAETAMRACAGRAAAAEAQLSAAARKVKPVR